MKTDSEGAILTCEDCRRTSDSLADVLCWFAGFEAAHAGADRNLSLPPGLDDLRTFNINLKGGCK